eukprot:TRINITY_DN3433_c0_g1_i1.p1 TRINITY_DN3433_c0_g1~~TRINITY_DN3433_c0_g1_i1.p1  ORF type:complete len:252 (+),score=81.35 TRINITY_DN3433_c0_g1_i1:117-872(+)
MSMERSSQKGIEFADAELVRTWEGIQETLKERLSQSNKIGLDLDSIRYVGGVDISFIKGDPVNACACFVVLTYPELKVVTKRMRMIKLTAPYIAGFLAFREVDFLVELIKEHCEEMPEMIPDLIMVDGNGVLHTRGFGLASHLGVLVDIPTIGIGKTLLNVDGLNKEIVLGRIAETEGDITELVGESGRIWGAAFVKKKKPLYISVGHLVSLPFAIEFTKLVSNFRIPEPVRQADLLSRDYVRQQLKDGTF